MLRWSLFLLPLEIETPERKIPPGGDPSLGGGWERERMKVICR